MRPSKRSNLNQDPIHHEQQKLFIFMGQLASLQTQLRIAEKNANLLRPLNLLKYETVASQTRIELQNLIDQLKNQMSNLKEIVGDKK